MRPLTDTCPKALLQVGGRPLIVQLIERLAAQGFRDFVINHAHLGAMIEAALGDGSAFDVHIRYSPEGEALETAGGIARALVLLGDQPFAAVNADLYTDYPFVRLRSVLADGALAHLVLVDNPVHHPRGDFSLTDGIVANDGASMLTFSGIGVYRPELFASVAPGAHAQLATLLRRAAIERRVAGEHFRGDWRDIGTPDRLAALDAELRG